MKNTGVCPKCRGNDIVRIEGNLGAYGSGNNIPIGFTVMSAVKVTRFLCANCGFSEEWIDSGNDLEKIKNKFR